MRAFLNICALSVLGAVSVLSAPTAAYAAEVLSGPIAATLVRVIDAAERRGKCPDECPLAETATDHLRVFEGSAITLRDVALRD